MQMDEASAAAELVGACESHFLGEAFVDAADVVGEWSRPGMDFAADTRGVYEAERLVAVGELDHQLIFIDVRPSHLGRGVGTALADWAEATAFERGAPRVGQFVAAPDFSGVAILQSRGYAPTYTEWILRMDEGVPLQHHELPADVSIHAFTLDDAVAVHEVIEDAFASWDGRRRRPYEDWATQNLEREGTDPSSFRVAKVGGEVVGVCVVHDGDGKAWVHQLAVREDLRGHGLGQELLAEAFEVARQRGLPVGELSTDARTGAVGLYQRLGMRIVAQLENWEKALS